MISPTLINVRERRFYSCFAAAPKERALAPAREQPYGHPVDDQRQPGERRHEQGTALMAV